MRDSCEECEYYIWKLSRTGTNGQHYCLFKDDYMGNSGIHTIVKSCGLYGTKDNCIEPGDFGCPTWNRWLVSDMGVLHKEKLCEYYVLGYPFGHCSYASTKILENLQEDDEIDIEAEYFKKQMKKEYLKKH